MFAYETLLEALKARKAVSLPWTVSGCIAIHPWQKQIDGLAD